MAGIAWLIGWCFLVYETPRSHPRISDEELIYIETSIADTGTTNREVTKSIRYILRLKMLYFKINFIEGIIKSICVMMSLSENK